jgi:hypothetical protein
MFLDMIICKVRDERVPQMDGLSEDASDVRLEPGYRPINATDAAFWALLDIPVTKPMVYSFGHSHVAT